LAFAEKELTQFLKAGMGIGEGINEWFHFGRGVWRLFDAWFANLAYVLDAGRTAYIWGGYSNFLNYPMYLKKNGFYFAQCIV
jgi:DNA modification methylase